MTGWWRWLYYNVGWEYPSDPTEKTKRQRHEVLIQIKSYGNDIKKILLKEEGEVRESTPTIDVGILENDSDTIDDIDNIRDYTRLFEGFDIETKKKRRRKRNKSNNFNF